MAEQSGKREVFDDECSGRGVVATAGNVEEGETADGVNRFNLTRRTSNDSEYISFEMEENSGASGIGCCNIIKGRRLRTRHSEHRVAYHRNSGSNRSRPTLSESAGPREIISVTTAIANAAQRAARITKDIVDDIKDTTRDLQLRVHLLKNKAYRMQGRDNYHIIGYDYLLDSFDGERAAREAKSAYEAAFSTGADARDAANQLSEAINMGSTDTKALEKEAITAFASADRATILCYQEQYVALQTLKKCKQDLIPPVFPRLKYQRCDIKSSPAILLIPILNIGGWIFSLWSWFEFSSYVFYAMFSFGIALIVISILYALYKLGSCLCKVRARKIRKEELKRSIANIEANLRWLRRHYIKEETPRIPLNEG